MLECMECCWNVLLITIYSSYWPLFQTSIESQVLRTCSVSHGGGGGSGSSLPTHQTKLFPFRRGSDSGMALAF